MNRKLKIFNLIIFFLFMVQMSSFAMKGSAGSWIQGDRTISHHELRYYYGPGYTYKLGGFGVTYNVTEAYYESGYNDWFKPISSTINPDLYISLAWSRCTKYIQSIIYDMNINVRVYEYGKGWLSANEYIDNLNLDISNHCSRDFETIQPFDMLAQQTWTYFANWALEKALFGICEAEDIFTILGWDTYFQERKDDPVSFSFHRHPIGPQPRNGQIYLALHNLNLEPTKNYRILISTSICYMEDYWINYEKNLYFGNSRGSNPLPPPPPPPGDIGFDP